MQKLPRINRVGKYRYHTKTGASLPRDVPETHPAFIAAWEAEEAKLRPAPVVRRTISLVPVPFAPQVIE